MLQCDCLPWFSINHKIAFNYFCTCLAFGLAAPALPALAVKVTTTDADAAVLVGTAAAVRAFFTVFSNPAWGHISDSWGRKPVLAISSLCCVMSFFLLSVWEEVFTIVFVSILLGTFAAGFPVSFAMMGDLTDIKQDAKHRPTDNRCSAAGLLSTEPFTADIAKLQSIHT